MEESESADRAGLGRRLAALAIDAFLAGTPLALLLGVGLAALISVMAYRAPAWLSRLDESAAYVWMLSVLISLGWCTAYSLVRDGLGRGQSLGKRLVGLRVVRSDSGRPCNWNASAQRNLPGLLICYLVAFLPFALPLLLVEPIAVLTHGRHLRLGDRWARTEVLQVPASAQAAEGS